MDLIGPDGCVVPLTCSRTRQKPNTYVNRQLSRRGPRRHCLDRPLYALKEKYLEHAIRIAPSTFDIWNDDSPREVIRVRNRITGHELNYPRRKKLRLSAAIRRQAF